MYLNCEQAPLFIIILSSFSRVFRLVQHLLKKTTLIWVIKTQIKVSVRLRVESSSSGKFVCWWRGRVWFFVSFGV